jgi:protein-tyrosine phosphatase
MAECGIKTIINLMEAIETDHNNNPFYEYSLHTDQFGIETVRMPIRDLSVPSTEQMIDILNKIDVCHAESKAVYVHCWGGIGRTGTVVGCYMIRHSYATPQNVLEMIEYITRTTSTYGRTSPETVEQIEFVQNWKFNQ